MGNAISFWLVLKDSAFSSRTGASISFVKFKESEQYVILESQDKTY